MTRRPLSGLRHPKCDPHALGVERTWGCGRDDGADEGEAPACPYHAATRQHALLEERFGEIKEGDAIPMFPTETGDMMTGEDVAKVIEYTALLLGEVLQLKGGVRRYGKQFMARYRRRVLRGAGLEHAQDRDARKAGKPHHCALRQGRAPQVVDGRFQEALCR